DRRDHEGKADGDPGDMRHGAAEAVGQSRRQHHDVVRPRGDEHHDREHDEGEQKLVRHGQAPTASGTLCRGFDSSMMAMPPITVSMPASRKVPNCSPKMMLEAAEPTNGTSRANGTTCAAG